MLNTYVEYDNRKRDQMPKQKDIDLVSDTITINNKEYTTVQGAQRVLSELVEGKRKYSRWTAYRMLTDYDVEVIRTPSANYYSVEGLRQLKDKLSPERGTHSGIKHYSDRQKQQAIELHLQGLSNREVARRIQVSYQTVNNWLKKSKEKSEDVEKSS